MADPSLLPSTTYGSPKLSGVIPENRAITPLPHKKTNNSENYIEKQDNFPQDDIIFECLRTIISCRVKMNRKLDFGGE